MNTYAPTLSDLDISKDEIYLNLGYGGQKPDSYMDEMIDHLLEQIAERCVPQAGYLIYPGTIPDNKHLQINDCSIEVGRQITGYFTDATHFAVFVVTAGQQFDLFSEQLRDEGDVFSEFLLYSIGTEIAEATVRFVMDKIRAEALQMGFKITESYSPGHCNWHLNEQPRLFKLLPEKPCGIELTDSNLMHPLKSVSGIVGMGDRVEITPKGCDICGLTSCFKRKNNQINVRST